MLQTLFVLIVGSLLIVTGALVMVNQYFDEEKSKLTILAIIASDPTQPINKVEDTSKTLQSVQAKRTFIGGLVMLLGMFFFILGCFSL